MDYIRTEHLAVGYGGSPLIEEIALHVEKGQIVTLIGPNGAGKSTILKSIIGQLKILGGAVYLDGRSMKELSQRQTARRMAVLMTQRVDPELMTCYEVAAMGRYPYTGRLGILAESDREKVREALSLVGAESFAGQEFSKVSDGQRQRILLARAICQEPQAIILDEPTSFLDIHHKLELLAILKDLVRKKQVAVLMSLHELELAQRVSDYIVCVRDNAIERCGSPEEIFTSDYIARLYGIARGSYQAELGFPELEAVKGKPQVFVIGGNGSGIAIYRRLQRRGIPFAAGILHENDLEYPVAKALAAEVVTERAFESIGEEAFCRARTLMESCGQVICCLKEFGSMNEKNRELAKIARRDGKLSDSSECGETRR